MHPDTRGRIDLHDPAPGVLKAPSKIGGHDIHPCHIKPQSLRARTAS